MISKAGRGLVAAAVCGVFLVAARADDPLSIAFANVGNAGNAADTEVMVDGTTGYGGVAYTYRIGKYEVSDDQFNAVAAAHAGDFLADSGHWTGGQPAAEILLLSLAMFCNWLTSGDVLQGAYTIDSATSFTTDRASALRQYGTVYVVPIGDEWYKVAYYDLDLDGGLGR